MLKFLSTFFMILKVASQPSPHGFKVQYIGHPRYVSPSDEQNRDFCESFWCTNDANLIFTKSSQYENQDPCEDFKNFTVGKAWEIDAVNDRYPYRGFSHLVQEKFWERQRKVAAEKMDLVDNRVVRIIKNTFKRCLKSRHTFRHLSAHEDIINHLKQLGSSPFLTQHVAFNPMRFNASADYRFSSAPGDITSTFHDSQFNLTKIIRVESHHLLNVFMGLQISRCAARICIKIDEGNAWSWRDEGNYSYESYRAMFEALEDHYVVAPQYKKLLKEEMFDPPLRELRKFLKIRNKIIKKYSKRNFEAVKIEEIDENLKIDWSEVINSQLMERSQAKGDDFVVVQGGKLIIEELIRHFMAHSKSTLADIFTITYLYHHRYAFILRFYNRESEVMEARRQSVQRWQRCLEYPNLFMQPAFYAMYEKKRPSFDYESGDFDRRTSGSGNIVRSAKEFVENAMLEAKKRFVMSSELPLSVGVDVLMKLKHLKIIVGVTNKTLRIDQLEDFYDELKLAGDESFFKSVLEMEKFHRKLINEEWGSRRRRIDEMVKAPWMKYDIDKGNLLYISPIFTFYPAYHPLRPHFFNMATLFYYAVFYLDIGIRHYVERRFNLTDYVTGLEFTDQIGYEHYVEWLKTHTELQIGANYLTNPQLYFVARIFVNFVKFQRISQKFHSPIEQIQMEYLHLYYKIFPGFQQAFRCKLNARDLLQIFDVSRKFGKLVTNESDEFLLSDDKKVQVNKAKALLKILARNLKGF